MEPNSTYSETELIDLLQRKDRQGFTYLYSNYSGALFGIIHQIVPDGETCNDVLQEVFVNIWRKINLYDPAKGRLFTWMLNIARNAAIDKVRSKAYKIEQKNQPLPDDVHSMQQSVKLNVDHIGLRKVVQKLKEEHRLLVELSYFQGYTHDEIAKALDIPLGTVKTRIRAALVQLRNMISS